MKRILITGANSYIGVSFERYLKENFFEKYAVDTVDMISDKWKSVSFNGYDAIFHVAGIAHRKETSQNAHLYYEINRDLVIETAKKAKADGVGQFLFLSSMSVYGINTGTITRDTVPSPKSNYGKSKLQAEDGLQTLSEESFKVCILRPPMVYGKGCKGNFQSVVRIVKKSPVFPKIKNERSMIYIDNLCEFVRLCVERGEKGIHFPQNSEYGNTTDMAALIADALHKKIHLSVLAGGALCMARPCIPVLQKAFGSLVYSGIEEFDNAYCVCDFKDSILKSV